MGRQQTALTSQKFSHPKLPNKAYLTSVQKLFCVSTVLGKGMVVKKLFEVETINESDETLTENRS